MENTLDLGFALGFIAGEGSFTGDGAQPALCVRVVAADPEPLLLLRRVFGGRIYGPYAAKPPRQEAIQWMLRGPDLRRAVPVIEQFMPPSRKREQFDVWRQRWWPNPP